MNGWDRDCWGSAFRTIVPNAVELVKVYVERTRMVYGSEIVWSFNTLDKIKPQVEASAFNFDDELLHFDSKTMKIPSAISE